MGSKLDAESPITQRVIRVINESGLSVTKFAAKIHVAQSTLNQQLIIGNISSVTLVNILQEYPDMSAEWLMRGTGEMYDNTPNQDFIRLEKEVAELQTHNNKLSAQVELLNKVIEKLL